MIFFRIKPVGVTQRTVARWKQQGFVRRGPVIAMQR